jgi:type VI secretion system protein ImpA
MPPLDMTDWLGAVDDAAPAGPNLEFDPDFGALERAAQGEPERQAGDTLVPAKEPEWKAVEAQAAALMARTRDLRVLGHLAVARLHLAGLPGYADVLTVIRQLLEARWAELHPQLDPEDDNDPTLRATSLLRVADPALVLRYIRDLPLARSPRLGRFSWRDISVAIGAIQDDERPEKPTEAQVRSAFQDTDPAYPAATRAAAVAAAEAVAAIPAAFDAKAGVGTGPNFTDLSKLLGEVVRFIDRYGVLPAAAEAAAPPQAVDGGAAAAMSGAQAPRSATAVTASALTEVSTRADALRLLELACQYYRRYEPSSPLPLLIERALRLAEKNFLEILRDIAPDGVMQAQNVVSGREE